MSLVDEFQALGIALTADGNKLRYRAVPGAMTPEMRDLLESNKPALLVELAAGETAEAGLAMARPDPWGAAIASVFDKLRAEMTPEQRESEQEIRQKLRAQ